MKKVKMLALALSSAVMIAGAGYAAWDDSLQVNTTVDTGELSVRFVGPHVSGADYYWASPRMFYSHNTQGDLAPGATLNDNWASATPSDLLKGTVAYSDKTMTFEFKNMYPGTRGAGKYTMENDGSIPAVIQNVSVTPSTVEDLGDDTPQVLDAMKVSGWLTIVRDGQVSDADKRYISNVTVTNLEDTLNSFFIGKRLQPGDKVVLGASEGDQVENTFNFELPINSLNGNQGEKETVKIDVQFDFVQHNAFDPTP